MTKNSMVLTALSALVLSCSCATAQNKTAAQDHHQRLAALERIAPAQKTDRQRVEQGRLHYSAGQLDEALRQAQTVLATHPDNAGALFIQGDVLRERKQWQKALTIFNRINTLTPNRAEIELRRGQALMELGKAREADAAFARYRTLNQVRPVR